MLLSMGDGNGGPELVDEEDVDADSPLRTLFPELFEAAGDDRVEFNLSPSRPLRRSEEIAGVLVKKKEDLEDLESDV